MAENPVNKAASSIAGFFDCVPLRFTPLRMTPRVLFSLMRMFSGFIAAVGILSASTGLAAAPPPAESPEPVRLPAGGFRADNIVRPLRYTPRGTDFVITNGAEFFNRPLYGGSSPFRVDGGDKPEFSLYLPGRGGNLRRGIKAGDKSIWLNDAAQVVTIYRPGSIIHEIHDPLLGNGVMLRLTALALHDAGGMILRAELAGGKSAAQLVWAFGGVNGMKGRRDGDIGCEKEPVG